MMEPFITIFASIYAVWYAIMICGIIYTLYKLPLYLLNKASVNIKPTGLIVFIAAVSWLLTVIVV